MSDAEREIKKLRTTVESIMEPGIADVFARVDRLRREARPPRRHAHLQLVWSAPRA